MEVTHPAARESIVSSGSLDAKEQVRQAVDIVDLVGHYIQLRRQGRGYVGLCPWHDDSRPSLQVNPERQSFKCWVCDIGGDVFSFIMQMEGISFREALEMLAERAGIELKDRPAPRPGSPVAAGDKQTLFRAMAWAESLYHKYLLESPDAEPARRYLNERGITAESIEQFHIGFAPNNWEWILSQAQSGQSNSGQSNTNSSRAKVLEAVGLLGQRTSGGTYDRFRGRVLFSIRDTQNRPVGLGGRILPEFADEKSAKYYNTSDTPLFSKSNLLYALDVARQYIHKKFDDTALVMEGYTDVIMAHQHGFENSVAVLGTALGEQHVKILKRFAKRVVLVLDGDQAGQDRANQVLELFIAQDLDMQVLTLPDGTDPCDYLQEHGAAGFQHILDNEAVDALEHARRVAVRGVDLQNDVHGATAALERVLSILAKASRQDGAGGFREDKILQRLATGFGVAEVDVRQRLKQLRRSARRPLVSPRRTTPPPQGDANAYEAYNNELAAQDPDGYVPQEMTEIPFRAADLHSAAPCEYELLEVLIKQPDLLDEIRGLVRSQQLTQAPCRRLYETICRLSDDGQTATFERLMLEFDAPAMKAFLVELDESERTAKAEDPASLLLEIIRSFERIENQRQDPAQVAALKNQGLDESQKQDLLLKMLGDLRARHGISDPTDG